MSRIALWFDGGGDFGFGNICRSEEMARVLTARGHEVACVALSSLAKSLCSRPVVNRSKADVVILDVPYSGDDQIRCAQKTGAKTVALDYKGVVPPDAVINLQRQETPVGTRSYVGIDYAIIRADLRNAKGGHGDSNEIVVILGGGDSEGLADKIVHRLPEALLCIVQGPNAKPPRIACKGIRVLHNPANLSQLMAGCPWAITSGGTTMLEMLFLGRATHVVPRTLAESTFAQAFMDQGALLGLGLETLQEPNAGQIQNCQRSGPKIIDGMGAERIAEIVESLL